MTDIPNMIERLNSIYDRIDSASLEACVAMDETSERVSRARARLSDAILRDVMDDVRALRIELEAVRDGNAPMIELTSEGA